MTKDATIYTNANTKYRTRNNLGCIVFIAEFNTCLLLTLYTISIKQLLTKNFITFFFFLVQPPFHNNNNLLNKYTAGISF